MNRDRIKARSVFIIIGLFLLVMLAQVIMYGNFFSELKKVNQDLNDLSRTRGSIQRYTKLMLTDSAKRTEDLEKYVDRLLARAQNLNGIHDDNDSIPAYYDINQLRIEWEELKLLAVEHLADPNQYTKGRFIEKSELCWEIADATVLRQQYLVSRTTAYYRYFTITFGVNLLVIITALLLYKKFVYNSIAASAIKDSLTGIFNKGYFDQYLEYEIARSVRKQRSFSLIMLDIDHFKRVNDTYGHFRGDCALTTLASVINQILRKTDVLARVGGEEFMVLLPDAGITEAGMIAERIRVHVEGHLFEEIGTMTISLGVTEFVPKDSKERILKRVDSALYLAKENGRNRCEIIEGKENDE